MENEDLIGAKSKKKKKKIIIIAIILLMVIVLSVTGIFVYSKLAEKPLSQIFNKFVPEEKEYTIPLEEFLVNLNSDYGDSKQYLRINMALMYTDTKQTEKIQSNISLIRDLIITSLRDITLENALEEETMINFKKKAINCVNDKLGENLIKEMYITDIIVK